LILSLVQVDAFHCCFWRWNCLLMLIAYTGTTALGVLGGVFLAWFDGWFWKEAGVLLPFFGDFAMLCWSEFCVFLDLGWFLYFESDFTAMRGIFILLVLVVCLYSTARRRRRGTVFDLCSSTWLGPKPLLFSFTCFSSQRFRFFSSFRFVIFSWISACMSFLLKYLFKDLGSRSEETDCVWHAATQQRIDGRYYGITHWRRQREQSGLLFDGGMILMSAKEIPGRRFGTNIDAGKQISQRRILCRHAAIAWFREDAWKRWDAKVALSLLSSLGRWKGPIDLLVGSNTCGIDVQGISGVTDREVVGIRNAHGSRLGWWVVWVESCTISIGV